jgi:hypothetical protein
MNTQTKNTTDPNFITSLPEGSGEIQRDRQNGWVLDSRFIYHFFNCDVCVTPIRQLTVNDKFNGTMKNTLELSI